MTMQEKIRPGYKQTEIGVIPEDWEVKRLGKIGEISGAGVDKKVREGEQPVRLVNYMDAYRRTFIRSADLEHWVTAPQHQLRRCTVEKGDVFFTPSSEIRDDIANSAVAIEDIPDTAYSYHVVRLRIKDAWDLRFRAYAFQTREFLDQAQVICDGSGTRYVISLGKFRGMTVTVPERDEQAAIAEALSDADARIAALEALVAKKRDLKQAAMQQLLTGKTRLPGFSGEWEVKRLGKIGEISGAGVDKKVREGEQPVRLVNYMDAYRRTFIRSADLEHWVTAPQHQLRRCTVEKGDVFFTPSSEIRDDIANSAVAIEDIPDTAYSYHVVRLRIKDAWDLRFRAYAFQTREFLDQAQVICDGSGTRYVISLGKFRGMTVTVPERDEQAAIAEILSDMDSDLAALEAETEKARTIKQGMMQTLLTGKVRLV